MAVTVERLVATLEARIDKYEKNLQKAYGQTDRQFTKIERRGKAMEARLDAVGSRLGRSFSTFGRGMVAALAAGLTVGKIRQFSDAATSIDNALKVAGLSGKELEKVYGELRDAATQNAVPLEALVEVYSRASMAAGNLGASQEDLAKFSKNLAVALRVSGKSATEAAGALLQLSQLMSGSVVQATEYNSLIDGAYPLLQAVAAGLKEAGGDVGKLTQLVKSGQVPTKAFFDAFQAGSVILDEKVASATFTISQAFGNLQTALIDTAREFNHTSGAAENAADNINTLARTITDFDVSGFIQKISSAKGALETFLSDLGNSGIFTSLNQMLGITDSDGNVVNLETKEAKEKAATLERDVKLLQETIAKNTELGIDNTAAIARLNEVQTQLSQLRTRIANMPAFGIGTVDVQATDGKINDMVPFNPLPALSQKQVVSLADYDPPKPKGKGSRGHHLSADDRIDEDVQSVKDRTAALKEEVAITGLSYQEQEKRRMALDLEQGALHRLRQEAARKGEKDLDAIKLSPEQVAKIDAVSDAYARQADELRKVQDRQQDAERAASDFYDTFKSDALDAVTGAQTLGEALEDLGKKFASLLLNSAFDSFFKPRSGGSDGGIFGSIFGALGDLLGGFGGARAGGGPVQAGKAYLVNENTPRSELFVPGVSGTILPREAASKIAAGSTGDNPVTISPVFNVDASHSGPGVGAEVEAALKKAMDNLTPAVAKSLREIKLKGIRV